jgi:hypothetical protein
MRICLAVMVAAGLSLGFVPDAMAQGKKGKAAECLNALVCGPQKVPQRKKPAKEQFMRSAS